MPRKEVPHGSQPLICFLRIKRSSSGLSREALSWVRIPERVSSEGSHDSSEFGGPRWYVTGRAPEGHSVTTEGDTIVTSKLASAPKPCVCLPTTSRHSPNARYHHPHLEPQRRADLSPEADQTELSSPPFDSISSVRFSPFNSAHLLASSWDAVSSSCRIPDRTPN